MALPNAEPARGFTLLEVLIAFTLVAFVLGAALRLYSSGFRGTAVAEQYVIASMLAQSKLDEVAAAQPLLPREETGITRTGYRWQASVRRYADLASGAPGERRPVQLFDLAVTVAFGGDFRARTLTLRTLRVSVPTLDGGEGAP